jgi:hypothetical protein
MESCCLIGCLCGSQRRLLAGHVGHHDPISFLLKILQLCLQLLELLDYHGFWLLLYRGNLVCLELLILRSLLTCSCVRALSGSLGPPPSDSFTLRSCGAAPLSSHHG